MLTLSRVVALTTTAVLAAVIALAAPASAAPTAVISGTVTTPGGAALDGTVTVELLTAIGSFDAGSVVADPVTGAYTLSAEPGSYRVLFHYEGTGNYVTAYRGPAYRLATTTVVALTAGTSTTVNHQVPLGGTVTGTVSAGGLVPEDLRVFLGTSEAWWVLPENEPTLAVDPATGTYTFTQVQPETYHVQLCGGFGWRCTGHYPVAVASGAVVSGFSDDLVATNGVEGTITQSLDGQPAYTSAFLMTPSQTLGTWTYQASADAQGHYQFEDVTPGAYRLCFAEEFRRDYVVECWNDTTYADAELLSIGATTLLRDMDVELATTSTVTGRVVWRPEATAQPLANATVSLALRDSATVLSGWEERYATTNAQGEFTLPGLQPGTYAVRVELTEPEPWLNVEYWSDALYLQAGDAIVLEGDDSVALGTIELDERSLAIGRLEGPDRFATAVAVSQAAFPEATPDVPVVYIANGLNYPDALAAGPAAIEQGGVLLTVTPTALPGVVREEIERLDPDRIVIVGGVPSVGAAVQSALAGIVGAGNITRLGGANRYETGRLVVDYAFDTADYVYIATANNYPDALSAGPAAGSRHSPVLLVNGAASDLDAATTSLIDDLEPNALYIVGSANSVSAGIEADIEAYADAQTRFIQVHRFAGLDRYATSYLINDDAFGREDVVFAAIGSNFADALTGGPLAGMWGSPLYLTPGNCLMPFIYTEMIDAKANVLALLGSEASLTPAVEFQVGCSISWTP